MKEVRFLCLDSSPIRRILFLEACIPTGEWAHLFARMRPPNSKIVKLDWDRLESANFRAIRTPSNDS
jgi:hypothetical protein